ncbi:MAG: PD-(D/E)XK nuclease family protein [Methanobrevibacter sp.]|nr:PD-(D/E)XK nuclease family protein [Methanobrevibacter sp.]
MNTIILNRMYAGSYLDENIGHEVINLFKDDNGSNYIYINQSGDINKKSNDSVEAVLLVKYVEKGVLEVVAKAEDLQQIYYKKNNFKEEIKEQIEYIKDHHITYGNVLLSDIYQNGNTELLLTFKTDKLRTVKKPVFIIEEESKRYKYENHYFLPEKHFSTQSLKMYYFENEFPQDYGVFKKLLNDSEIWNEENTTIKIDLDEIYTYESHEGFLSVIKKEDDELVISNLFSYIFSHKKDVFIDFVKEVLGIGDFKINYGIVREKDNIDLLIENEDSVIIIENKIKSKINGEKSKSSGKKESQLSKYVKYAHKHYKDKESNFYIFAPDYNQINLDIYECGEEYKIINYSKIYEFYFKNAGRMLNIKYFKEFLDAIYIHTMTTDNTNFEKMKRQFINNILELKKEEI